MSVLAAFLESAERHGARPAIIEGAGTAISFGELAVRAEALAGAFRQKGIGRGDRVLLAMPLGIDLYASLAALWWLGATAVFPEPALGLAGLRHAARATKPRAFLASGLYRALRLAVPEIWRIPIALAPERNPGNAGRSSPVDVSDDDPALISFTSGSTGEPKAIARSHGFLMAQNAAISPLLRSTEAERDLVAFPVFVLVNLGLGISSVLPDWTLKRPDKVRAQDIRSLVSRHDITRLLIPPILCEVLAESAKSGEDLAPAHSVFTGGGPLYPDIARKLKKFYPGLSLTIVYGSTEAEPIAHVNLDTIEDEDWAAMQAGGGLLAGKPVDAVALRLVNDEIVVCGDHVNKSYLDPSRNASTKIELDGEIWHRTGDAGRIDGRGRLWLLGRSGDGLDGLYPFSVEVAARTWPGVRRAALCPLTSGPAIAIEADSNHPDIWRTEAQKLGIGNVRVISAMPLDSRHRSKIDMIALKNLLN